MCLYPKFCKLVVPQVLAGDTVLFWLDRWQLGNRVVLLQDYFPRLHSFVVDDAITVKDFMAQTDILDHFHLPLS